MVPPADPDPTDEAPPLVRLVGVGLDRGDRAVLDGVDWEVRRGERWVVLGRNGSGKTTLARIATMHEHPSRGTVDVLGQRLGRCDVRALRTHVGFVSAAFADLLRPRLDAVDVVVCALHGALEPWWHDYTDADRRRARDQLDRLGVGDLAGRAVGTLSSGERQRVLLARATMADPELLVLDEPCAGLDLPGREELVSALDRLAAPDGVPAWVLVTHHLEEIPSATTHVALVRDGRLLAAGPIADTLDDAALSACMGLDVRVVRHGHRWAARVSGD